MTCFCFGSFLPPSICTCKGVALTQTVPDLCTLPWHVSREQRELFFFGKDPLSDLKAHSVQGVTTSWVLLYSVSVEDMHGHTPSWDIIVLMWQTRLLRMLYCPQPDIDTFWLNTYRQNITSGHGFYVTSSLGCKRQCLLHGQQRWCVLQVKSKSSD